MAIQAGAGWAEEGRSFRFERLGPADGLSSSETEDILQDRRGHIWIGTRDGLNRHDGTSFRVYRNDPDDPGSLAANWALRLFEDRTGAIWVGLLGTGLDRFDPATERFVHYRHDPADPTSLSNNRPIEIYGDRSGNVWIGTLQGLNRFDPKSESFTRYQHDADDPRSLAGEVATRVLHDNRGQYWVGSLNGLQTFDPASGIFSEPFRHDPENPRSLSDDEVVSLYEDREGTLWVGTGGGLSRFDRESGDFTVFRHDRDDPMSLSDDVVTALFEDDIGNFYVGTATGGLNLFDRETAEATRFTADYEDETTISTTAVRRVMQDDSGLLWLIGYDVTKWDPGGRRFRAYRHEPDNPNSLIAYSVDGLHETNEGLLFLGSNRGGLTRLDPSNNQYSHYVSWTRGVSNLPAQDRVESVAGGAGGVWVGTWGGGLRRLDPATGEFTTFRADASDTNSLSYDWVPFVTVDRAGKVWIGTQIRGLDMYDPAEDRFTHYPHDPEDPASLSAAYVSFVFEDSRGEIWVGTQGGGLNRLVRSTGEFVRYQLDPSDPTSLSNNSISMIEEDSNGNLWVATGGGLNKLDVEDGTFLRYLEKDGLPSVAVASVLEGPGGDLWLGTAAGLSRFDPTTGTFRTYTTSDGLATNEFMDGVAARSRTGELMFGTVDGLLIFDPLEITESRFVPPVVLTDLELFNVSVPVVGEGGSLQDETPGLPGSLDQLDEIVVSHEQTVFSLEFSALSYRSPEKNRYAYKMEGFDEDWTFVGDDRRRVTYTNLDAGNYVFRVKASNSDGIWNEEGKSLAVRVLPPWWQTSWFLSLAVISAVVLAVGGHRLRVRSIERHNRELEIEVADRTHELEEALDEADSANRAKSTFLANVSHELRTPLNSILGFVNLMNMDPGLSRDNQEQLGIIQRSSEHLLSLINGVLDLSKIEAGRTTLNVSDVDLPGLVNEIEDMLSLKAEAKGLRFVVELDAGIPRFLRADSVKLRQIIINLLNNAIKFTAEGSVGLKVIRVAPVDEAGDLCTLRLEVADTGSGIAADEVGQIFEAFAQAEGGRRAHEGTGLGLPISRKFVRMMGGDISVESEFGVGTTFMFELPMEIGRGHEEEDGASVKRVRGLAEGEEARRLLVVDDRWENRELMIKLLEPIGFEIRSAENGLEAVEAFSEWQPDAILMDMRMPVMDGYEATRKIKATQKGKETPIIAVTASTFEEERAVVLRAGCDGFLRKPFREADLFGLLKKQLGVEFAYA